MYHITILLFVLNFHFNQEMIGFEARNDPRRSVGIVSLWVFATCPWSIPTRNASANEAQQLTVLGTCGAVAVSCCRIFFLCR